MKSPEIQRAFEQVSSESESDEFEVNGQWSSFLEGRDGEHSLIFLHQTGSSSEEFSNILPLAQKAWLKRPLLNHRFEAFGSPLSVFAPDRPCETLNP